MSKTIRAARFSFATAFALILCQSAAAQQTVSAANVDSADLVAEVRFLSLPVSVDKDGKQSCEMLDQLLQSSGIRNIEVQCPNRRLIQALQDSANPLVNAKDGESLDGLATSQSNDRRNSALVASLNAETVSSFIQSAQGDYRTNINQAPTITMQSGQEAEVFTGSNRPFVTGIQQIAGDFAVAHQPIISLIPEGLQLKISARTEADRIVVNATAENWSIRGVETIDVGSGSGQPMQVQFPDVDTKSVSATTQVAPGDSMLIVPGPSFTSPQQVRAKTGPLVFRKTVLKEENSRIVILITMKTLEGVTAIHSMQPDQPASSFYINSGR